MHWRLVIFTVAILLPISSISCGKKDQNAGTKIAQKSNDDFLDKNAKPDEREYLLAAKPFFIAIAGRKYADAYALLLQPRQSADVARSILNSTSRILILSKINPMYSTT